MGGAGGQGTPGAKALTHPDNMGWGRGWGRGRGKIIAPRRKREGRGAEGNTRDGIEKATNAFSGTGKHFVYFSDLSQVHECK